MDCPLCGAVDAFCHRVRGTGEGGEQFGVTREEALEDILLFREKTEEKVEKPAGGRGASVSVCADLTNQLQCCWVDPSCAWKKH